MNTGGQRSAQVVGLGFLRGQRCETRGHSGIQVDALQECRETFGVMLAFRKKKIHTQENETWGSSLSFPSRKGKAINPKGKTIHV